MVDLFGGTTFFGAAQLEVIKDKSTDKVRPIIVRLIFSRKFWVVSSIASVIAAIFGGFLDAAGSDIWASSKDLRLAIVSSISDREKLSKDNSLLSEKVSQLEKKF